MEYNCSLIKVDWLDAFMALRVFDVFLRCWHKICSICQPMGSKGRYLKKSTKSCWPIRGKETWVKYTPLTLLYTFSVIKSLKHLKNFKTGHMLYLGLGLTMHVLRGKNNSKLKKETRSIKYRPFSSFLIFHFTIPFFHKTSKADWQESMHTCSPQTDSSFWHKFNIIFWLENIWG